MIVDIGAVRTLTSQERSEGYQGVSEVCLPELYASTEECGADGGGSADPKCIPSVGRIKPRSEMKS